jgi:hypothetical protein
MFEIGKPQVGGHNSAGSCQACGAIFGMTRKSSRIMSLELLNLQIQGANASNRLILEKIIPV